MNLREMLVNQSFELEEGQEVKEIEMDNFNIMYYRDKVTNQYCFLVQGEDFCECNLGYEQEDDVITDIEEIILREAIAW